MRGGTVAVVASILLAGCAGMGATSDPRGATAAPTPPTLPEGAALDPGEVVARDAAGATFRWGGAVDGSLDALEDLRGASSASARLSLPAGAALHVEAALHWNGSADLDLLVLDDAGTRCLSTTRQGGPGVPIAGAESCVARLAAGGARTWTVEVVNEGSGPDAVAFEVLVAVRATVAHLPYDLASGPAPRAAAPDPATPGPREVATTEYDLGAMVVEDRVTKRPYPVRLLGVVHAPVEGEGLPVVVLLHGRHQECGGEFRRVGFFSHCRAPGPAGAAVPSHRGFDGPATLLASHGYVVVSVDANDVNALDSPNMGVPNGDDGIEARAKLLMRTLDELRRAHEAGGGPANPGLDALRGRLDLTRIGLMGHSRGAEGATRAPEHARETGHWSADAILAVYSLAGTVRPYLPAYLMPTVKGPTAYFAVSPYCDGDIADLGNLDYYDAFAADPERGWLAHALVMGANHDFFNAAWWDGDDAEHWGPDAYCGADGAGYGRLSPQDQMRHLDAYLSAFFRLHLGGEAAFAPLFTGEAAPPASACPAALDACPGLVHASAQPLPGKVLPLDAYPAAFDGFDAATPCAPRETSDGPCAWPRAVGQAPRVRLAWTRDASWTTSLPALDLRAFDTLSFRAGVDFEDDAPPGGAAPRVSVALEDARGGRVEVDVAQHSGALFAPPGDASRRVVLSQVRVPLDAFDGVDLGRVTLAQVRFSGATPGAAQVADLAAMDLG